MCTNWNEFRKKQQREVTFREHHELKSWKNNLFIIKEFTRGKIPISQFDTFRKLLKERSVLHGRFHGKTTKQTKLQSERFSVNIHRAGKKIRPSRIYRRNSRISATGICKQQLRTIFWRRLKHEFPWICFRSPAHHFHCKFKKTNTGSEASNYFLRATFSISLREVCKCRVPQAASRTIGAVTIGIFTCSPKTLSCCFTPLQARPVHAAPKNMCSQLLLYLEKQLSVNFLQ